MSHASTERILLNAMAEKPYSHLQQATILQDKAGGIFTRVPILKANHFPRMAKCGSPVNKSPGTAALWAHMTLVYKGTLGSPMLNCSNFLHLICKGRAISVFVALALRNGLICRALCPGLGNCRNLDCTPKATWASVCPKCFLQTCSPSQVAVSNSWQSMGKAHCRFTAFMG